MREGDNTGAGKGESISSDAARQQGRTHSKHAGKGRGRVVMGRFHVGSTTKRTNSDVGIGAVGNAHAAQVLGIQGGLLGLCILAEGFGVCGLSHICCPAALCLCHSLLALVPMHKLLVEGHCSKSGHGALALPCPLALECLAICPSCQFIASSRTAERDSFKGRPVCITLEDDEAWKSPTATSHTCQKPSPELTIPLWHATDVWHCDGPHRCRTKS